MGDPKKKRKKYDTPRKKWDKQLLETEKKLVEFYGLKNKKDLRKHETWLRRKRQIARSLLALTLDKRKKREEELMNGLARIGLVKGGASLDEVLSLKIEELLERRLQTVVMRKGLANTSNQARQFITHGHIAIEGKKIDSPSYLVSVEKISDINWYNKKIKIDEEKPKTDLKKEFEKSAGIEVKEEIAVGEPETIDGNPKKEASKGSPARTREGEGEEKKEVTGEKVETPKEEQKEEKKEEAEVAQ